MFPWHDSQEDIPWPSNAPLRLSFLGIVLLTIFPASRSSPFYSSSFSHFGIVGQIDYNHKNSFLLFFLSFNLSVLTYFLTTQQTPSSYSLSAPEALPLFSAGLLATLPTSFFPSHCGLHLCPLTHSPMLFLCKDHAEFLYCVFFLSVTSNLNIFSFLVTINNISPA